MSNYPFGLIEQTNNN